MSPLMEDIQLPVDLELEDSKRFVNLAALESYAMKTLPTKVVQSVTQEAGEEEDYNKRLIIELTGFKNFLNDIKVIRQLGTEKTLVPIAEIHRPKVPGCTASFDQTYTESEDYSISVEIFGLGGGGSTKRKFSNGRLAEIEGECVRISVPATIEYEEYEVSHGPDHGPFIRSKTKDIEADTWIYTELKGVSDNCGFDRNKLGKTSWSIIPFDLPEKVKTTETLKIENGRSVDISLEANIAGITIGPKATIEYIKEQAYSYTLIGKRKYVAYSPNTSLAYYWNIDL